MHYLFGLALFFVCSTSIIESSWAENRLATMSLQEKIGQLFVVAAVSSFPQSISPYSMEKEYIEQMITNYHIGGLLFLFRSTPTAQINLFNWYNTLSKTPLMTMQDGEWGLHMRLDDTICFPKQMTLGAIQDNDLLIALGYEIGRQCKLIGVDMNLAPVADINTNSANPVIGKRSFGSDPFTVADKAYALMRGMQQAGIGTCAKHFPGHGDTIVDSHYAMPIVNHDIKRLQAIELEPFQLLINKGIDAIMVGHLLITAYDKNEVATLSKNIVTDLLKNKMHFNGLVITDGLGMDAIHNDQKQPGEVELQAFLAGNDILLAPVHVPEAVSKIEYAVTHDENLLCDLNCRVLKILQLKEKFGVHTRVAVDATDVQNKLHTDYAYALKKQLYQNAITLAAGSLSDICFTQESPGCIVQIGGQANNCFAHTVQNELLTMHMSCPLQPSLNDCEWILQKVSMVDTVLLTVFDLNNNPAIQFGISSELIALFEALKNRGKKVIVILFGTPYAVTFFQKADAVLVAYEDDPDAQQAVAEILLGKRFAAGKLPILTN
jgi:beta-glucosidase-like glycosyl hydrolase